MMSSRLAVGLSLRIDWMALVMLGFEKPRLSRAVAASSAVLFASALMIVSKLALSPLTILSFNSNTSLWALFNPIPLMDFNRVMFSDNMASLSSAGESEERIILAEDAPIPDTLVIFLNRSRSSFVANP